MQYAPKDGKGNYDLFLHHVSDAVISMDMQFRITGWNRAAGELFGQGEEEVLGKEMTAVTGFPVPATPLHPSQKIAAPYAPGAEEMVQGYCKGKKTMLRRQLFPAIDKKGQVCGYLFIVRAAAGPPPAGKKTRNRIASAGNDLPDTPLPPDLPWQNMFDSLRDAFITLDKKKQCTYLNKKAATILGKKPSELLGRSLIAAFGEQAGTDFVQALEKKLTPGKHAIVEEYYPPLGQWLAAQVYPSAEGYLLFIRDITRKKQAETALKESEEKYRLLIEQASDGIFIYNKGLWCLMANTSACKMTGYTLEELRQTRLTELLTPAERQRMPPDLSKLEVNKISHTERELQRKDGSTFYAEAITQMMPSGQAVAFIRDITERKKVAMALHESEERYRLLFNNNPLPMMIFELKNYRFLDVNKTAIDRYGYSKREFLNMTALDIRPPEDIEKFYKGLDLISNGLVNVGVFRHLKKTGETMEVEIYLHDFQFDGQKARLVLAVDITEKRKAETGLLETTRQLRELSAHLQDVREEERANMAREIHDELGQQLTILKMDISWLGKKLRDLEDAAVQERIAETLNMLNETIQTVRRLATTLRPSMLDDLGLVAAMEWQSKEFGNRSDIRIWFKSNLRSGKLAAPVATSLFRIYQETLTNVGRHAQARNVWADLWEEKDRVTLTVRDDGRGFDMQSPAGKKTLGLLGMRERALMLGGQLEISSIPGKGTTIFVTTPLEVEEKNPS